MMSLLELPEVKVGKLYCFWSYQRLKLEKVTFLELPEEVEEGDAAY